MDIEMVCIEGLDDAIVGTGFRSQAGEVLVYDADKCNELLMYAGYGENCLPFFLESLDIESLGDRAPFFIYLDGETEHDVTRQTGRPKLRLVH
jgi:hypothetical protein